MNIVILLFSFLYILCGNVLAYTGETPINIDSRIKTLIYNPNEIYTLNLKMGFQSIIEFSIDESVELISIGDP